jgi:hypothetical protein
MLEVNNNYEIKNPLLKKSDGIERLEDLSTILSTIPPSRTISVTNSV